MNDNDTLRPVDLLQDIAAFGFALAIDRDRPDVAALFAAAAFAFDEEGVDR